MKSLSSGPSPPRRRGPRPLALHLAAARAAWLGARATDADRVRFRAFLSGIRRYHDHPFRRPDRRRPVIWQRGRSVLLDGRPAGGFPVLVVPSLVNRAAILDLLPGASFVDRLAAAGLRPLLLDWGEPRQIERQADLDELILDRLAGALDWTLGASGMRPAVVGYCMGGTLALALASQRASDIAALGLLAAPFDFHAAGLDGAGFADLVGRPSASIAGAIGALPVDLLQALFASVDPLGVPRKFARFASPDLGERAIRRFVAVEDWLNDGVPLGAEIARACLLGWYGFNQPARGTWRVGGEPVRPERLARPVLLTLPDRDRIVPQVGAAALADRLPRPPAVVRPRGGHIGMVVAPSAEGGLYGPLLRWLGSVAAMQEGAC